MKKIIIILATTIVLAVFGPAGPEISSVSAKPVSDAPQATQEKPLTEEQVNKVLDWFKEGLPKVIGDKEAVEAIVEKLDAHEDLVGKTTSQILAILLKDVNSVDPDAAKEIAAEWQAQVAQARQNADPNESDEQKNFNAKLSEINRQLTDLARQNEVMWNTVFSMMSMGGEQEYDAEAVVGFYLLREDATPNDAFLVGAQGLIAYQKWKNRAYTPGEQKQIADLLEKTFFCGEPQNCAALREGMKKHAAERLVPMLLFIGQLNEPKNSEALLKALVVKLNEEYQEMESYDPYKIEADCLKNGGDEVGCVQSTYFGLFGYGLFGKQAEEKVHIDQKSLDLVNRWKNERFAKFQCIDGDCKKGMELKPKP